MLVSSTWFKGIHFVFFLKMWTQTWVRDQRSIQAFPIWSWISFKHSGRSNISMKMSSKAKLQLETQWGVVQLFYSCLTSSNKDRNHPERQTSVCPVLRDVVLTQTGGHSASCPHKHPDRWDQDESQWYFLLLSSISSGKIWKRFSQTFPCLQEWCGFRRPPAVFSSFRLTVSSPPDRESRRPQVAVLYIYSHILF